MAKEQPKKPRKSKQLKLTLTERAKWSRILKEVEKAEAPISVIQVITVNLIDGTQVTINVQELLDEGVLPDELEDRINSKLRDLDHIIKNVDFFISVENVAKTVQPFTDNILRGL